MDSGLGNQMLDYAEYLAIRKANPDGEIYIENIVYDIKAEGGKWFSQWNGYELDRIFGIKVPLLKDKLGAKAWSRIAQRTIDSEFWMNRWDDYAPVITNAINQEGYNLTNLQKNSRDNIVSEQESKQKGIRGVVKSFFGTAPGYHIKRHLKRLMQDKLIAEENAKYDVFQKYPENTFLGHSFALKYKGFGIEKIDLEIRKAFIFPDISDNKNQKALEEIRACNAVSIHARRSDMLFINGYCYKFGYFKRAVRYIKKHVDNPVFYFFCDENSRGWCEENEKIFGLNFRKDDVRFVTWNKGTESYRDMQLMSECKHNIFTESTFGFWGAYLNSNPDKITCAPDPTILATNWF